MPRTRLSVPRTSPRPTAHKYPVGGNAKSYLIRDAPRRILDAALKRAHSEQQSLRVVLIDFLEDYGKRRAINFRTSADTEVSR